MILVEDNYYQHDDGLNGFFSDIGNFVSRNIQSASNDVGGFVGRNIQSATNDVGRNLRSAGGFFERNIHSTEGFFNRNIKSAGRDISLNNIAKYGLKPVSLITGVEINGMSDISLNNTVKIVARAAPIALAFIPGIGPVLAGVASGVLAPIGEKGTDIGLRDVNIRNAGNIALSVGTSIATAGLGRGLDKLGGKLASGSIGRGVDAVGTKLVNTGAGRFVSKYANTAVGKVFTQAGRKLIKTAEGQIKDAITGVVIGTATNLLIKQPDQGEYYDSEFAQTESGLEPQPETTVNESAVPNINQIQTIAKLTDKPVEQVVKEQISAKISTTAPETKGISTGVKVAGGIAVAGAIWYLIK